jgi:hypothetical protein
MGYLKGGGDADTLFVNGEPAKAANPPLVLDWAMYEMGTRLRASWLSSKTGFRFKNGKATPLGGRVGDLCVALFPLCPTLRTEFQPDVQLAPRRLPHLSP